jgi:hypothetical protein
MVKGGRTCQHRPGSRQRLGLRVLYAFLNASSTGRLEALLAAGGGLAIAKQGSTPVYSHVCFSNKTYARYIETDKYGGTR